MNINIYLTAKKINKTCQEISAEYQKRIAKQAKIRLINLGDKLVVSETDFNILLDTKGCQLDSEQFASKISEIIDDPGYRNVNIFTKRVQNIDNYDLKLSLSSYVFDDEILYIMLSEQIYRAFAIINNTKYHK